MRLARLLGGAGGGGAGGSASKHCRFPAERDLFRGERGTRGAVMYSVLAEDMMLERNRSEAEDALTVESQGPVEPARRGTARLCGRCLLLCWKCMESTDFCGMILVRGLSEVKAVSKQQL